MGRRALCLAGATGLLGTAVLAIAAGGAAGEEAPKAPE